MRLVPSSLLAILLLLGGSACSSAAEEPAPGATEGTEVAPYPDPVPAPEAAPPPPAAEEPAAPAAAPATPTPPPMPPFAAVIIHDVKDYDAWRPHFDGHTDARKAAGMVGESVMRSVDNDKTVVVYSPASDIEKLKAFMGDKALKDKMKEAGVKGKPTIYVFKLEGGKVAQAPAGGTLFGAVMKQDTKDFAAFKTAFEAEEAARGTAGIVGWGIGQGVDKDTEAYVYLQSDDAAKLKAYIDAKETKAAMKAGGAKGQPKVTLVKEESTKMY